MSWAEVKKFLNKRTDKALNEIIQEYGDKGAIKSIQRGIIAIASGGTSGSAKINAVDPSKSVVLSCGEKFNGNYANLTARLTLDDSTTVSAVRYANGSYTSEISYQVVEFN